MPVLAIIICLLIGLSACGQATKKGSSTFTIDSTIEQEVEASISAFEGGNPLGDMFPVYENPLIVDYYEFDSLVISSKEQERKLPFKSFFYTQNDTLSIDGFYGLFGGFGFSIKIIDDQASIYHLAAGDDFPTYSMTKEGALVYRVEVPCSNTKLILSKNPVPKKGEIIYGVVEFDSDEYYQSGPTVAGKEIEERTKISMNMKVYFKSNFIDLEEMR